jgi:hypothetical protein
MCWYSRNGYSHTLSTLLSLKVVALSKGLLDFKVIPVVQGG